jgi:hypothetical protein
MLNPNKFSDLPLLFNLLPATTNNILNAATALIQFIGLVGVFVFAVKLKINLILRIIIIIFLFLLLFFDGIIVWMAIYYLSHSPQIG